MNALLLPGNSSRHAAWVEDLKVALADSLQRVEAQHYRHWQTGGDKADVEYEIGVAQGKAEDLEPYTIIAKSIGTVIAVKGTAEGRLRPQKLILLGVPINGGVSAELFSAWLQQIDAEVIFLQNTNDPLGSFGDVKSAFENTGGKTTFVELPGDTHDYVDFAAVVGRLS